MSSDTHPDAGIRRPSPFVIEFLGTPGAGKTTLALVTVDLLRRIGVAAETPVGGARDAMATTRWGRAIGHAPDRLERPLLWRLFSLRATVEGIRWASERGELRRYVTSSQHDRLATPRFRRHVVHHFSTLAGRDRLSRRYAPEGSALVVDDGFVHRAATLHSSHLEHPDARAVETYLDLIPTPDLVVVPLVPPEICTERVLARGVWSHARDLDTDEVERYVWNASDAVDIARRRILKLGWPLLEIPNADRPLEQVELQLTERLVQVFAGRPVPA
jgi:thymidylate kinase